MIAASHIGTTSASQAASNSSSGARRDGDSPSFSESLSAASQTSHLHSETDHTGGNNASSKRQKESNADTKVQAKHVDDAKATTPVLPVQTQVQPQTQVAIALPNHLLFPAAATNTVSDDKSAASSNETSPISSVTNSSDMSTSAAQSGTWAALNGTSSWSPASIATKATGADSDIQADNADVAEDVQVNPASVTGGSDTQTASGAAGQTNAHDPKVADGSPTAAPYSQDGSQSTNSAQDTAVASQVASMVAVGQQVNTPAGAAPAASSFKATTALKGLQGITSSTKNTNSLSNPQVAGAKETDSYLSIQKNSKTDGSLAKDSSATAVQHGTKDAQTQEQFTAPAVMAQTNHAPMNFEVHQQKTGTETAVAPSVSAQDAAGQSLEAQAKQAAATSQPSPSELSSAIVNSAKLIQSIGQSEMRVGLRTSDFGDISIRTSSTRDSISAQISLAHGDLAQTLTAHMPEMQTRLTSGETVDVHIQHEGQAGDFSNNTGSNGNQGGSQGQTNNESATRSIFSNTIHSSSETATVNSIPSAVFTSQSGAAGRLDIRA